MKKFLIPCLIFSASLFTLTAFSQNQEDSIKTLGLPGDNLDLYAVLTLFQKSKTIEAFEKDLNLKETGINNLDLDLDKKVDFIKVVTTQQDSSFTFTLQVDVTKTETQDVASILVDKDKNGKVLLQIVGAEALYGKDYVIEPKGQSSVTANPAYTGSDPVATSTVAQSVVTVQSAPIVQYVYSPVYVPYYPPYYYGYYPAWHFAFTAIAIGVYHNNCYHYHGGYYGGHYGGGNTIIINNGNRNNINHNNSNFVNNNRQKGNYGNGNRPGGGASATTRPAVSNNKAGTGTRQSGGAASAATRPSTGGGSGWQSAATRPAGGTSGARPSTSNYSSSNRASSNGASRSMSSGGRSMSSGAGMNRGGGGGRRR
jgi:hypothetical protein